MRGTAGLYVEGIDEAPAEMSTFNAAILSVTKGGDLLSMRSGV